MSQLLRCLYVSVIVSITSPFLPGLDQVISKADANFSTNNGFR